MSPELLQTYDFIERQRESPVENTGEIAQDELKSYPPNENTGGIGQGEPKSYLSEVPSELFSFGGNNSIKLQLLDDVQLQIPGKTLSSQPCD